MTQSIPSASKYESLIQAALQAKEHAYTPYYHFRSGAALLAADGSLIRGANVEQATVGGLCAERTAFVNAVSEGKRAFVALAVVTDVLRPLAPCGQCRQMIREFCSPSFPIFLVPADYPKQSAAPAEGEMGQGQVGRLRADGVREITLGELLPESFGPEYLELPRMVGKDVAGVD